MPLQPGHSHHYTLAREEHNHSLIGHCELQKFTSNGATYGDNGVILNAVGEMCRCSFFVDESFDLTQAITIRITAQLQTADANGYSMKQYCGYTNDGSAFSNSNVEAGSAFTFQSAGVTANAVYHYEYTLSIANFQLNDLISFLVELNEASRSMIVRSISIMYKLSEEYEFN